MKKLSVVIPILNDSVELESLAEEGCLQNLNKGDFEILVADGGSTEEQMIKAQRVCDIYRWKWLSAPSLPTSLSLVLQNAVQKSRGQRIFILPCDCRVNQDLISEILHCPSEFTWGGFPKMYMTQSALYPPYLWCLNHLLAKNGYFVWTNGIFADHDTLLNFQWPEGSFLVDWNLSNRLADQENYYFGNQKIIVSDRKYKRNGVFRRIVLNGLIILFHSVGIKNIQFLKKLY